MTWQTIRTCRGGGICLDVKQLLHAKRVGSATKCGEMVRKQSAIRVVEADPLKTHVDAESKVAEHPQDHKMELRLWLRLLASANLIEVEVRQRLREEFGTTLPRFDL